MTVPTPFQNTSVPGQQAGQSPARLPNSNQQNFPNDSLDPSLMVDQPPAMEDYTSNPFTSASSAPLDEPTNQGMGQSVLVRDETLTPVTPKPMLQPSNSDNHAGSGNQLRGLSVEPRRLRDNTSGPGTYPRPSRMQPASTNRGTQDLSLRQSDGRQNDAEPNQGEKSCDDYRSELLDAPITEIVLDISPLPPKAAAQTTPEGLTRTWTDCQGNILATGTLRGLERSYVVIDDQSGQGRLLPISQLSDADLVLVSEFWGLPVECSLGCDAFAGRNWLHNAMFWKASALCHKPLYFENRQLERYGHTHGPIVEPFHSSVHFFTSMILWPYNAGINPPNECLYALGFYKPGDCAPWLKEPFPFSLHGAVNQGLAIGALGAIIP